MVDRNGRDAKIAHFEGNALFDDDEFERRPFARHERNAREVGPDHFVEEVGANGFEHVARSIDPDGAIERRERRGDVNRKSACVVEVWVRDDDVGDGRLAVGSQCKPETASVDGKSSVDEKARQRLKLRVATMTRREELHAKADVRIQEP